jgi:beta-mannosidase
VKGANYIPQDVFLPRINPTQYEALISVVKDANMNMLRVWGGGVYERDLFYDLCDEKGILVWQDFMFAGSLYPDDTAFADNVKAEVIEAIKRLRGHPCLAIWCGNNEIEVAWENWGWQKQYGYSAKDSIEIWNNYKSLFHKLIPGLVSAHHPQGIYTPTSPLSNWGTAENFNHSSMHYWGVWHGREPFESFENNVGRFMVEYGFQSFPSIQTLRKVIADSSLYWDSPALVHRQKSYIAKGMQMAIQAHVEGQPHCMGSLFWQLNDCWPGPSWSVIDYYGNKKSAYNVVKSGFAD